MTFRELLQILDVRSADAYLTHWIPDASHERIASLPEIRPLPTDIVGCSAFELPVEGGTARIAGRGDVRGGSTVYRPCFVSFQAA